MAADSSAPTIIRQAPDLPPLLAWSQEVTDELIAIVSTPEKFVALLLIVVIGGVATAALIWLAHLAWRLISRAVNLALLRLGTVKALRRFVIGAYLRRVREVHGRVSNIYLEREDQLDLSQVFVPLKLRGRDGGADADGGTNLAPRDTRAVLTDAGHGRLMILGDPGSGKTTLMKALASGISQRQWPELADTVPVYVRLRAYVDVGEDTDPWDWLAAQLEAGFGLRHAGLLLDALARDGQLLLLLDGLDEIGEAAVRWLPARIAALGERLAAAGGARLIVTCREQNYDLLPDPGLFPRQGFAVFRLAEMRDAEVEAVVARREPDFAAKGKSTGAFLARVRAAPAVAELHRNPLLLTLSIGLYLNRAEDRVPHDLAEFYDQGIDNLLRRHDFATKGERGLRPRNSKPYRDKLALLQRFALDTLARATAERRDFEV
jgi:energy-coupling factor transporter ATP-binding protein EcfA2